MYERTYNAKLKQREMPKEKRPFNWKRFFTILGIIVVVGGSIYIIRLPQLQVHDIEIVGANAADPQDITEYIQKEIEGSYFFIFPRKSMLLVPTTVLSKKVASAFPRFATVDVRRKGINNLVVTVEEHEGAYLWCKDGDDCYFMNKDGLVYAKAPTFSGDAYVKLYGGASGDIPFVPLGKESRSIVVLVSEKLPAIDITPAEVHFISDHEFDVLYHRGGHTIKLLFDPTKDLEESLQALYTAFKTETFESKYKNNERVLEYIDLRFPNKVVYKFL